MMVLASLALGALSYRYVEQPSRTQRDFWTPRRLLAASSVSFALFAGFVSLAFLNQGFPGRLPEYLLPAELARRTNTPRDECFRNANSTKKATETYCSFGSEQAAGQGLPRSCGEISFANQYLEPISAAALAQRNTRTDRDAKAGAGPSLTMRQETQAISAPCRQFNRSTLAFVLAQAEPSIVVLGSNWANATEISAVTDRLLSAGKTVVLIMPLLNIGFDLPQRWIENQIRAGNAIEEWKVEAGPGLTMRPLRDEIARILDRYRDNPRFVRWTRSLSSASRAIAIWSGTGRPISATLRIFPTSMRASTAACSTRRSGRRCVPGRKGRRKRTERRTSSERVFSREPFPEKLTEIGCAAPLRQAVVVSAGTPQRRAGGCGKSET